MIEAIGVVSAVSAAILVVYLIIRMAVRDGTRDAIQKNPPRQSGRPSQDDLDQLGKIPAFAILCLLALVPAAAMAQVPPDQAMAKLRERAAQREADRAKQITITKGELEDLKARIEGLQSENNILKAKLQSLTAAKPHRAWTKIDLGMTRAELMIFVKAHPHDYQIAGDHITAGDVVTKQQKIVQREGSTESVSQSNGGKPNHQQGQDASETHETVQTHKMDPKKETIEIQVLARQTIIVGSSKDALGAFHPEYGTQYVANGTISVELTDDVVTKLDQASGN